MGDSLGLVSFDLHTVLEGFAADTLAHHLTPALPIHQIDITRLNQTGSQATYWMSVPFSF